MKSDPNLLRSLWQRFKLTPSGQIQHYLQEASIGEASMLTPHRLK